jgi:hypothetical protein
VAQMRPTKLYPPVDVSRDHVLGCPDVEMTVVEYGRYACHHCHAVHDVVALRSRFGDRMRYVLRRTIMQVVRFVGVGRCDELTDVIIPTPAPAKS